MTKKCCLCETDCEYEPRLRKNPSDPVLFRHYECNQCGEFLISITAQTAGKEKLAKFACQRNSETYKSFVLYTEDAELQEISNKDQWVRFKLKTDP
jgi:hypothetical protein